MIRLTELKCEYAVCPIGIDNVRPRFSWLLSSEDRGQAQTAYRVLVASSRQNLDADTGDKWDSGMVESDRSVNVIYDGSALTSGETCWWKVKVADADGAESEWSEPATFEMGLLDEADWRGDWIESDPHLSSPLFRKTFHLSQTAARARVHICGLGYYELYVNGRKVSDRLLDPATTYYHNDQPYEVRDRVLYVTHDVTEFLRAGENAIGIMLGNGLFSIEPDIPHAPSHREPYGDMPRVLMQMNVECDGGENVSVVTDDSWAYAGGPILYNDYCNGEVYDARLEKPGWDLPDYDEAGWVKANIAPAPGGALTAHPLEPVRVMQTIPSVKLEQRYWSHQADFGQNISGWTRIRVSGPRGTRITLRHGTAVDSGGALDARSNLHNLGPAHIAHQQDTYVLNGDGVEVWEPRFTMHGFRYVDITGVTDKVTLESIEARHVRTSAETVGSFTCSNDLLNKIHSNCVWTFASSMQGYPQDAADRSERVGWLGDPIPDDFTNNFDSALFWSKWALDIDDAQWPDGNLPFICPVHWRNTGTFYGTMPVWLSTLPIIVWGVYETYDDVQILERHYDCIVKLLGYFAGTAKDHILPYGLGDHMEPQETGLSNFSPLRTPAPLTSTAYYYHDALIAARSADLIGKPDEAQHHRELAEKIKQAFNGEFFDAEKKQYATGSQTANAIALLFNLVPEEHTDAVFANLVSNIEGRDGHLFTGMLGTNALVNVLPRFGTTDVMHRIATQTTFPSWGYMVESGATTLWETWDGKPELLNSRNMKLLGSVDKFFYKDVAGIASAAPGFRRIRVRPGVVGDLTSAKASIKSVRGLISVEWQKGDGSLMMKVTIPANTTAEVHVPKLGMNDVTISESGTALWKSGAMAESVPGVTDGAESDDCVVLNVGSGSYEFELTGQA